MVQNRFNGEYIKNDERNTLGPKNINKNKKWHPKLNHHTYIFRSDSLCNHNKVERDLQKMLYFNNLIEMKILISRDIYIIGLVFMRVPLLIFFPCNNKSSSYVC